MIQYTWCSAVLLLLWNDSSSFCHHITRNYISVWWENTQKGWHKNLEALSITYLKCFNKIQNICFEHFSTSCCLFCIKSDTTMMHQTKLVFSKISILWMNWSYNQRCRSSFTKPVLLTLHLWQEQDATNWNTLWKKKKRYDASGKKVPSYIWQGDWK